jgi:hypothetical protein
VDREIVWCAVRTCSSLRLKPLHGRLRPAGVLERKCSPLCARNLGMDRCGLSPVSASFAGPQIGTERGGEIQPSVAMYQLPRGVRVKVRFVESDRGSSFPRP